MQREQPSIVLEYEHVRRARTRTLQLIPGGCRDVFKTIHPCHRSMKLHRDSRHVHSHECGVLEDLFPVGANAFPSGQSISAGMNAAGAAIGGPDLLHQIEVEAFECEVELE